MEICNAFFGVDLLVFWPGFVNIALLLWVFVPYHFRFSGYLFKKILFYPPSKPRTVSPCRCWFFCRYSRLLPLIAACYFLDTLHALPSSPLWCVIAKTVRSLHLARRQIFLKQGNFSISFFLPPIFIGCCFFVYICRISLFCLLAISHCRFLLHNFHNFHMCLCIFNLQE